MPYKDKAKARECNRASLKRQRTRDPVKAKEQRDKWIRENPDSYVMINLKSRLKRKYRMTLDTYHSMLKAQDGVCACCQKEPWECSNTGRLVVDHNHITGAVRGLLCNNCNSMIGFAGEDALILQGAIAYLDDKRAGVVIKTATEAFKAALDTVA